MVVLVARKTQEIDRQTVLGLSHEQMQDNSRWVLLKINKLAPCVPNGNAGRLHKRPAIVKRGEAEQSFKMTITMQTINNLSSKPFQSVELVRRHSTDGSDCVARCLNPACFLTSSHLVDLCTNRA